MKTKGNELGKVSLPHGFNYKYGCCECLDRKECEQEYTETQHIKCRYADILDAYNSYKDYDRAAKKNFAIVLSRFPEFTEDL